MPPQCLANFLIFADKGYPWTRFIAIGWPQPRAQLTAAQGAFQREMSALRIVVEWGFNDVGKLFPFVNDVAQCKVLLQPVGRTYRVATFLKNCHVCLNGSTTAQYFSDDTAVCEPPSLAEYLWGWA